jgi:hypothetical protein
MGLCREAGRRAPAFAWVFVLLLWFIGSGTRLEAQAVHGQLVNPRNAAPINGAFVTLLDQRGTEVARALTGEGGTFLLGAPGPGDYRLRFKRIGYRLFESPTLQLAEGQTLEYRLEVEAVPSVLPPVLVEGEPQCGFRSDEATTVARLWEEVQEALQVVTWTERAAAYDYTLQLYDLDLSPNGRRVERERISTRAGHTVAPFASAPAEELRDQGYVVTGSHDTLVYLAPDAEALLSEAFIQAHCFTARPGDREHQGLVGLAFEPVERPGVVDIRGALWLDLGTLGLRFLEFEYAPQRLGRGYVEFMPLSPGTWIVKRWWIRMAPAWSRRGQREAGGRVVTATSAHGSMLYVEGQSVLEGDVVDSSRSGAPLPHALVRLVGTGREARADGKGHFQLAAPIDGTYDLTFAHPRLDSLGIEVGATPVTLMRDGRSTVRLAVPSEERIVAGLCPGGCREGSRVIVGAVRAPGEDPMPGAVVHIEWPASVAAASQFGGRMLDVDTDVAGWFVICDVPSGEFHILATHGTRRSAPVVLEFSATGVWINHEEYRSFRGRVWSQDLHLLP